MIAKEGILPLLKQTPGVRNHVVKGQSASKTAPADAKCRIYAVKLPQRPTFPALTFQTVSRVESQHTTGADGLANARIQIDCWAKKYDTVTDLANEVRLALNGYRGPAGTRELFGSELVQRRDGYEDEVELFRVTLDFDVWYRDAAVPAV